MVSKGTSKAPGRNKEQSRCDTINETAKSSDVKVVVRVRPLNAIESSSGMQRTVVRPMDERVIMFDPVEELDSSSFLPSKKRRRSNILDRRVKDLRFIFDRVFDEHASNTDIFDHTTKSIIDGILNG